MARILWRPAVGVSAEVSSDLIISSDTIHPYPRLHRHTVVLGSVQALGELGQSLTDELQIEIVCRVALEMVEDQVTRTAVQFPPVSDRGLERRSVN
mgnify:CR=1 FL=1